MLIPLNLRLVWAALLMGGGLALASCGGGSSTAPAASPVQATPMPATPPALDTLAAHHASSAVTAARTMIDPAEPARTATGAPWIGGNVELGETTTLASTTEEFAWAIYPLQGWRADSMSWIDLELGGSSGTVYVGVSNYQRNAWNWQAATPASSGPTRVTFDTEQISALQDGGAGFLTLLVESGDSARFGGADCSFIPTLPVSASGASIGVPVQTYVSKGVFALPSQATDQSIYSVCNDPAGPTFVIEMNQTTGVGQTYSTPGADHTLFAATQGQDGAVYYSTMPSGEWFRFNPQTKVIESLGVPVPGSWTYSMSGGSTDGNIWGGNYETMELVYYSTRDHGFHVALDPVETTNTYPRTVLAWQGTVLVGTGPEKPSLYVYYPDNGGQAHNIWPEDLSIAGGWVELIAIDREYNLPLIRYVPQDGALDLARYFVMDSQENLTEIDEPNWAPAWTSDGREVWFWSHKNVLEFVQPDGKNYFVYVDADRSSANIYNLCNGPDGTIYGGTFPCHLFNIDPVNDVLGDMGNATGTTGQIYGFANLGTKLYMVGYPRGNLSVYDTDLPYKQDEITHMAGTKPGSNPRDLGNIENFQNRPLTVVAAPDGRIYIGSLADYGHDTGALTMYDPATEEFTIHELYPGEAITGLVLDADGELWGTSWYTLFHWNQATQAVDFELKPVEHTYGTNTRLTLDRNGIIMGMCDRTPGYLYAFDPVAREMVNVHTFTDMGRAQSQSFTGLATGPDGLVYGMTIDDQNYTPPAAHLWVVDPATFEPRTLWLDTTGALLQTGLAFHEDNIYVGAGSRVVKVELAR